MRRWRFLVGLNVLAQVLLLGFEMWVHRLPRAVVTPLVLSLGFPFYPVIYFAGDSLGAFVLVLMLLNPLLWATMVEAGLRRFVDPPKDSGEGAE